MNDSQTTVWPFGHLNAEKASQEALIIADFNMSAYSSDPKVIQELKRYFLARKVLGRSITMQSIAVDEAWHAFILDTRNYITFCEQVFGEYLHHRSAHFELSDDFPGIYEELFGSSLDPIWLVPEQGANCNNCA